MIEPNKLWRSLQDRLPPLLRGQSSLRNADQDDARSLFTDAVIDANGDVATMDGSGIISVAYTASALPALRSAWEPSGADRIYQSFDASRPVADPGDLRGRDREISALLSGVLYRHNHGLVAGPRGSGKTSLVRVFAQYAEQEGVRVIQAACDGGSSWGELLRDLLQQVPSYLVHADDVELFEERIANLGGDITPLQATTILTQIAYSNLVMIVDEFDRVEDRNFHSRMASMMKLLSDARVPVRFILVGGSSSFEEIIGEHASLVRHITRLATDPLPSSVIEDLLERCSEGCGMQLAPEARDLLTDVVCGSPYHARLFGMHAALAAVAQGSTDISLQAAQRGLMNSFQEWAALNPDDAQVFTRILEGSSEDNRAGVEAARAIACGAFGPARSRGPEHSPDQDHALAVLGSAVDTSNDGVSFKDATAAQFLLAAASVANGPRVSAKQRGSQ